jgi:hypothetical protein
VFDVSGSFVWQTDVAAKKMLRCAWMAAMRKLRRSIWTVAGSWLWGDSDRCCAMHISTLRAERSHSLRARMFSLIVTQADVQGDGQSAETGSNSPFSASGSVLMAPVFGPKQSSRLPDLKCSPIPMCVLLDQRHWDGDRHRKSGPGSRFRPER